jgi:hypothetical protein
MLPIAQEYYLYELGKGVIEVQDNPALEHGRQVHDLRRQIGRTHPRDIEPC